MKTTGFSRVSKDLIIEQIERELKASPVFFVVRHGGLSATSMDKLRAKLRAAGSGYRAVKNSLGRIALEKSGIKELQETLSGNCGFAFTYQDPVAPCKILVDFAKENERFQIQAGYMNGKVIGLDQVKVLASLPSREVLLTKVVTSIQFPLSRLVGTLSGAVRKVVTVLDAIARKKQN